jgi:hypothetical protein
VAKVEVEKLVEVNAPYEMLGVVALGYPAEAPEVTARRTQTRVVRWFEAGDDDDK